MDLPRTLLIGAIAVLSFMLLTEWVTFKDAKTAPIVPETSRLTGSAAENTAAPSLSDESPVAAAAEDIPEAPEHAASDTPAHAPAAATGSKDRIIEIYTDVLQLAVDLNGGDIVRAVPAQIPRRTR
ncbi:MAG: hypothetical protein R3E50_10495 [Halioglobus sp.]